MSDYSFSNNGYTFRGIELEMQRDKMLIESSDIKRVIRGYKREYKRLSDKLANCNVVRTLSSASACISSFALSTALTFQSQQQLFEASQDMPPSPVKNILTVLTLGSFAVAGASEYLYNKTLSDMKNNKETQQELEGDLELNEDSLEMKDTEIALNFVRGAIQRDKDDGQVLEPEISIIDVPLSHIKEVDDKQDFTPPQSKIINVDFTNPSAYFNNTKPELPPDLEQ